MLTKEQAVEILKTTRQSYASVRPIFNSYWCLAIAYDAGRQWAYQTSGTGFSNTIIKSLRSIVDPNREDVRVTMNLIHQHVERFRAALSPAKIAGHCEAASGSIEDTIVSNLGDRILDRWLPTTDGLRILREKDKIRLVLGTAVVRRTMAQKGPGTPIDPNEKKSPTIRDFSYGWTHVYPWEIIRDPSASTTHPERDEEFWCHEKPKSVGWVARNFGVQIETDTTIGRLTDIQHQVMSAYGLGDTGPAASKQKGVLIQDSYFKDPDRGDEDDWPYMMLSYVDASLHGDEPQVLFFGRNPFWDLPFYLFTCDYNVMCPWGFGIPHALMAGQDITNLALTQVLRTLMSGAGKWIIEKGSIEKPSRMLSNRIDEPIVWVRGSTNPSLTQAPQRSVPPSTPPVAADLVAMAPGFMEKQINSSDVLRGVTSKRGESGEAISMKVEQAGAVLDQLRRDDDLTYQDMLTASLMDVTNPKRFRMDTAKKLLGPDVPPEHVYALMRRPVEEAVKGVVLVGGDVHPQTPAETEEGVMKQVAGKLITPDQGLWRMLDAGISVDPTMARSRRKQEMEIQSIIAGQQIPPTVADNHEHHLRTLRFLIDSPSWHSLTPEARQGILEHYAMHMGELAQAMQTGPSPTEQLMGTPSVPAAALGGRSPSAGAGNPAINVA